MNRKRNFAFKLATSLIFSLQATVVAAQEPGQGGHYLIGSSVPGSVQYNIGVGLSALAQIVLLPEKDLNLTPVTTAGYSESLQKLLDGTAQFAIADSVAAHEISAQSDGELMAAAVLWHEVDHFILANEYVETGTISDLAKLRREDFATNLGNLEATRDLLSGFGVQMDDEISSDPIGWEGQRDDFDQGVIAGLAMTESLPSEVVLETLSKRGGQAQLLEFSHWQMSRVAPGWHVHSLTAADYPGLTTQVDTVARTLMLVVHRDVPEDAVHEVVRMMFDNLPYLINLDEAAAKISTDHALHGAELPVHPGAMRYYQEIGVFAEGSGDHGAGHLDAAAVDHSAHAPAGADQSAHNAAAVDHSAHAGHDAAGGGHPPEHVHDEAMLSRARAEAHDGEVVLKIGRPKVLSHPGTEIFTVYFGLGKTDLAGEDIAKVREITGKIMGALETYGREPEVYVEGYTDASGSWETNYEIAHSRARSVQDILMAEGVPESWIHIADYSEEALAVPTANGVAEERNRRVEITLIPQE